MSASADFTLINDRIRIVITTDSERAVCTLTPLEVLGLSDAAMDYGRKVLLEGRPPPTPFQLDDVPPTKPLRRHFR